MYFFLSGVFHFGGYSQHRKWHMFCCYVGWGVALCYIAGSMLFHFVVFSFRGCIFVIFTLGSALRIFDAFVLVNSVLNKSYKFLRSHNCILFNH